VNWNSSGCPDLSMAPRAFFTRSITLADCRRSLEQRRDLAKFVADLLFTGLLDSSDLATMFLTEVGSSLAQEDKTPEMNRITYRDCPPEFWPVSNHNNWKLFISHRISLYQ